MFNTNLNVMKRTITFSVLLLIVTIVLAQPPLAFNYQAILRGEDGNVISSQNVSLEIAIRKGSESGTIVFSETHNTSTNEFGLVNLQIGSIQSLASVNFSEDSYFLEMSVNGTVMGSSQLLSVPFAIHANTSADAFSGDYNDLLNLPNLFSGDYNDLLNLPNLDDFIGISNPQAGDILFYNQNQWQSLSAGAEGQVLKIINGMPLWDYITFPCGTATVTDIDGNVYNTVLIGDQCWMDKNLSTTHFRDGSPIAEAWVYDHTLVEGINSDEEMAAEYGRLYSWHTANDAKGICPVGWTLPAQAEFQQLVDYVIATYEEVTDQNVAYAFKSCRQVNSPLGGDCNTTAHPRWDEHAQYGFDIADFSALPAGRYVNGAFSGIGSQLYFWSSTEFSTDNGVFARIMHNFNAVTIWNVDKNRSFSLRCIKE
jgi:uncharacterized protein (TIGR02145 family)